MLRTILRMLSALAHGALSPFAWLFDLLFSPPPCPHSALAQASKQAAVADADKIDDEERRMAAGLASCI